MAYCPAQSRRCHDQQASSHHRTDQQNKILFTRKRFCRSVFPLFLREQENVPMAIVEATDDCPINCSGRKLEITLPITTAEFILAKPTPIPAPIPARIPTKIVKILIIFSFSCFFPLSHILLSISNRKKVSAATICRGSIFHTRMILI